jgi:hypothetical protein
MYLVFAWLLVEFIYVINFPARSVTANEAKPSAMKHMNTHKYFSTLLRITSQLRLDCALPFTVTILWFSWLADTADIWLCHLHYFSLFIDEGKTRLAAEQVSIAVACIRQVLCSIVYQDILYPEHPERSLVFFSFFDVYYATTASFKMLSSSLFTIHLPLDAIETDVEMWSVVKQSTENRPPTCVQMSLNWTLRPINKRLLLAQVRLGSDPCNE